MIDPKTTTARKVNFRAVLFLGMLLSCTFLCAQSGSGTAAIEEEFFNGNFKKADSLLTLRGNGAALLKLKGISLFHRQAIISAESSFQEALEQVKGKNKLEEASANEWLGHLFMKKREPEQALDHYRKSLEIHEQQTKPSGYALFYLNYFVASAYYLIAEIKEENKEKPFVQISVTRADKLLKTTTRDSLIAAQISKAISTLQQNPSQQYYQYTLLFTEFPALSISPEYYENLLNLLDETVMLKLEKEPIGITLGAQQAFWHLGFYQDLMDTYGKQIPVVHQKPQASSFSIQSFSKRGRENQKGSSENTLRYQSHEDLELFLALSEKIQQLSIEQFSEAHPAVLEFRNEIVVRLMKLGDSYHETHRYVFGEYESKKKRLDEAIKSDQPEKLEQADPGLVTDLELYKLYLKNKTFSLDNLSISLVQQNLKMLDRTVSNRLNSNPSGNLKTEYNASVHAACQSLLTKAQFLYDRTKRVSIMERELAEEYRATPFDITAASIISSDVVRAFNEGAITSWKTYEAVYDNLLKSLENTNDKLYWASRSRNYRLDALDAAMLYAPRNVKGQHEVNRLEDAIYFSERIRGTAFLSELAASRIGSSAAEHNYSRFTQPPTIAEIQKLLNGNTAILWWVSTKTNLYRFMLSKNQCKVSVTMRKEEKILPLVKAFRNGILFQQDEIFRESGHTLYSKLFPQFDQEITNLVIIPEREMALIPFEALLTKKVAKKDAGNYEQYPYLLNQYILSYDLSLTSFWLRTQWQRPSQLDFVAFAPVFMDDTPVTSESLKVVQTAIQNSDADEKRNVVIRGNGVAPLPGTKVEVKSIDSLFRSENLASSTFLFGNADEKNVKGQTIKPSSIVHFATHGFADPYEPASSGLIFADTQTGKEDGVLYGFEVLAMKVPAQLIVLSACETGLGKVFPGEGSVSLTRNFMLAGANNVISSLWQVSDASTQKLMVNFYGQLIQNSGLNYSLALVEAKKRLIREGFAQPYYWSAFLLHGR
jgi:CHAT domain-containing protein